MKIGNERGYKMRKLILSLLVICSITLGCSCTNTLKSSMNMQFYLVDRETKEEFLIVDISDNEFKVFEYNAFPEKGQIQKIVPVIENGKQKKVAGDIDNYYATLFLLLREGTSLSGEKSRYYMTTKDDFDNEDYGYELWILNHKDYFLGGPNMSQIDEKYNNERLIRIINTQENFDGPNKKEKFTYKNNKFRELWENKGNGFELVEHVDFSE